MELKNKVLEAILDKIPEMSEMISKGCKGLFDLGNATDTIAIMIKTGIPIKVEVTLNEKNIQKIIGVLKEEGITVKKGKRKVKKPLDAHRKKVLQIIAKMRSEGETFDKIALFLEKENLQTFSNRGKWHAQTTHRLCQDHNLE